MKTATLPDMVRATAEDMSALHEALSRGPPFQPPPPPPPSHAPRKCPRCGSYDCGVVSNIRKKPVLKCNTCGLVQQI